MANSNCKQISPEGGAQSVNMLNDVNWPYKQPFLSCV